MGREKFRAQQDEARQTAQPSENEAVDGPANKLLSAGLSTAMTIYHPTNMVQVLKWRWPASPRGQICRCAACANYERWMNGHRPAPDRMMRGQGAMPSPPSCRTQPPVNWSQQFARLLDLALVAPEAREAHGGAEFPGTSLAARVRTESAFLQFLVTRTVSSLRG